MNLSVELTSVVVLLAMSGGAVAGPRSYQCRITEQLFLTDSGSLKRPPSPSAIGERFAIDRDSGALVGGGALVMPFRDQVATVLARGNGDNAFVATYVGPSRLNGVHATFAHVSEFKPGVVKPFVLLSGSTTYSGVCE